MIDSVRVFDAGQVRDLVIGSLPILIPRLLAAILVLLVFWLGQRLTRPPLRAVMRRARLHETLIHMLVDNVYRFVVLVFGFVMAASQLGVNVTAALAGISIVGVAVGFAAQDTLSNIIAGFLIFWDKPFLVDDFITVQDRYGRVTEITMRTTRIRTPQNTFVVIPNKHVIDTVVVNHTKHGAIRVEVPIGIAYRESIAEARRVILEALRQDADILPEPAPDVVAAELASSSVDLLVRVWIDDPELERPMFHRTLETSKRALDAAGIQIPYPHLQLFLERAEEPVWRELARVLRREPDGPGTRS